MGGRASERREREEKEAARGRRGAPRTVGTILSPILYGPEPMCSWMRNFIGLDSN